MKIIHKMWWRNYSQTLFFKIKIERISESTVCIFIRFILLHLQVNEYQNILKLRCWSLTFTHYKSFLKNKKRSGTSLRLNFQMIFEEMYSSCVLTNWPFLLSGCLYLPLHGILGNMCSLMMNVFCLYICRQLSVFCK